MMRTLDARARAGRSARALGLGLGLLWGALSLWACSGDDTTSTESCPVGSESCPCTEGGSCDGDLVCLSDRCVDTTGLGSGGGGGASGTSSATSSTSTSSDSGAGGVLNRDTTSASTTSTSGSTTGGNPSLALPCTEDADCGAGLICVTAESSSLSVGGPAGGLCTQTCTDSCPDANSICLTFSDDHAYCVPSCGLGDGVLDCQARPDMVCDVLPASTGTTCAADTDCADGVCFNSECVIPISLCLPRCGADSDCPSGRFCDPSLGECVDDEPEGLGIGEPCDPDAATDECRGYCSTSSSRCIETCTRGAYPTCGSEDPSFATAECLAPYYEGGDDLGDVGVCIGLCDCTSDCASGLACVSFESPTINGAPFRGRAGLCITELEDDIILSCD